MSAEIPGYMRVRAYLYNLAKHGGMESAKIPSENELCRLFGVSRMTVREAIRGLVESRILTTRRGVGTFVNTAVSGDVIIRYPLIGLLHEGGRNVYNMASPALRMAVLESGMTPEIVLLPDSDDPARLLEMIANYFVAIIWDSPVAEVLPHLHALREKRIPLLVVGDRETSPCAEETFDTLSSSRVERGRMLGNVFADSGHDRICYLHNYAASYEDRDWPENPQTTSGALLETLLRRNPAASMLYRSIAQLEEVLETFRLTALYSENYLAPYIARFLAEKGISVPEGISYLSYRSSASYFFHGKKVACLDEVSPMQNAAIEWLDRRVYRGDHSGIFRKEIQPIIHANQTFVNRKSGT